MAAEEKHATRSRERGSIAAKPPRVVGPETKLKNAAAALVSQSLGDTVSALRIFNAVPDHWHGVVAVDGEGAAPLLRKGEVAVYSKYEPHIHGDLVDGGLYVIEYQTPRCGMSREYFAKHFASEYGSRLDVTRKIIRAIFRRGDWWVQSIEAPPSFMGKPGFVAMDGPYDDAIKLTDKIIGIVVGIYRGDAQIGGAA